MQNNSGILRIRLHCQDAVLSYVELSQYRNDLFYSCSRLKWTKGGSGKLYGSFCMLVVIFRCSLPGFTEKE